MHGRRLRFGVAWTVLGVLAALAMAVLDMAPAHAVSADASCVATVTISFEPPAMQPLPLTPAPAATASGTGTITMCQVFDGGATAGTFSYVLQGNLTCTSAQNVTGVLDIVWAGGVVSHATVTGLVSNLGSVGGTAGLSATVTSGRYAGDEMVIANLRDPLALIACLTTGLSQAAGTTSLTFTTTS